MAMRANSLERLLNAELVDRAVSAWLAEDVPALDVGGAVLPPDTVARAQLRCKTRGAVVMAGRPFLTAIFRRVGVDVDWRFEDGDLIDTQPPSPYTVVAEMTSSDGAQPILLAERTALNVLTRMAGVATTARRYVELARERGWCGRVAATRKTTPGFRIAEKYAVVVGGADPHRYDLSTMVMLKDNHISAFGNDVTKLIAEVRKMSGFTAKIEVESRNEAEAFQAAAAGADIVMLDNFEPNACKVTSASLKNSYPNLTIEASGGIIFDNISDYFCETVDVISASALTQGYTTCDFSLKIYNDK